MTKPTPFPSHGATQEIRLDQWIPFFAQFTREYRGAHARLDVFGPDVGYQVETEDRPFDGIAADVKDGARSVWITFGSKPADHLTHGVHDVSAVRLLRPAGPAGPALEIEVPDGTKSVLELTEPEAYALPPGDRKEGHP